MVVETFRFGAEPVYKRSAERGRMLPDGLTYIDSWVEDTLARCFQLLETDQPELLDEWIAHWDDLVAFEVVPVTTSADAARKAVG